MRNLLAVSALLLLLSCSDVDDCQLNPFRETIVTQWEHTDIIAFDSIAIVDYGRLDNDTDTLLASIGYSLPLDFDSEEITYLFYTDSVDYELTISYEKEIRIFEIDCDPAIRYFNLEILNSNFEKVKVRLSEAVDNLSNSVNIEISL